MALTNDSGLSSPLSTPPSSPQLPSSPLSSLSRTPSPGPNYRLFTPPPSQNADDDMHRPRKRRKIERLERTTRYLDLTEDAAQAHYDRNESMKALMHALRKRRKIVVIAGAGISVSAGIPDFRSSNGLFAGLQKEHKLKGGSGKQLFDASVYKDATSTSQFHDMLRKLSKMSKRAKPTAFHHMLARLAKEDRLLRLYTQNVDGLETQMEPLRTEIPLPHKGPWPPTIQLHGGLEKMMCQKCREILDFDPKLFDGSETPTCPKCVETDDFRTNDLGRRSHGIGRLRPRIVLYNEQNPDEDAIGAVSAADMRTRPDAVVVVGTSMKIPGVKRIVSEMCKIVRDRREGTTIWVNPDPEPTGPLFDNCWDLIVKGTSDQVANAVKLRKWDDGCEDSDLPTEYTDSDVERLAARQGEVRVDVPPRKKEPAVMTPPRSQHGDSQNARPKSAEKISPRIILKVSKKSADIEAENQRRKAQAAAITVNIPPLKTKNPASGGKKLTTVLGKDNVKRNRQSKTSIKAVSKSKKSQPKLQQSQLSNKVTKAIQKRVKNPTKPFEPDQPSFFSDERIAETKLDHKRWTAQEKQNPPCGTILRTFTHSFPIQNGSEDAATPAMTHGTSTPDDTSDPRTPSSLSFSFNDENIGSKSMVYDRKETISPKGAIPRGMANLLT